MTVHGILDIALREEQTSALKYNEAYVSLTRFLTSSFASLIGIQRIAYSTGSAPVGRGGEQYWDQGSPVWPNAWSCYKFLSATIPFYMLLQYSSNNSFGTLPGNPGGIDGTTTAQGVGIAFGMREDSGNAWAGTSTNNGSDTKGTPVWTAGASNLYTWPRSNAAGGTNQANKEMTMGVLITKTTAGQGPTFNSHLHMVCDENNIVFAGEDSADSSYRVTFFGKYTLKTNMTATCPYVSVRSSAVANNPAIPITTYGPTTSGLAVADGGIAHPTSALSGTKTLQTSGLNEVWSNTYEPGGPIGPGQWDEFPIHVGVAESPLFGYAGFIDFIKYVWATPGIGLSQNKQKAFFGQGITATTKVSVPWDGVTIPGTSVSRTGSMF